MKNKLKRLFFGTTSLLLIVMIFTYLVIDKKITIDARQEFKSILDVGSGYGISVIALIFVFPAFVFTILKLSVETKIIDFLGCMFSLFCGAFALISGIIGIFYFLEFIFLPIILILCAGCLFTFSIIGLVSAMKDCNEEETEVKELN